MEFKKYKIKDIGKIVSGGTPSTKINDYWGGNISWLTPKDLSNYVYMYISIGERNISKQGLKNSSAKLLPKNTVLLTSRAPIGYVAIANNELSTNQGFKSVVCDNQICDYIFFYYWLKNNMTTIKNHASGSTFQEISGKSFKNIFINLPSLKIQKNISSILMSIDNKIELNEKINQNLENIMKEIFIYLFVKFENIKKENFKDSKWGKIPKTFEIIKLEEIIEITSGKRPFCKSEIKNNEFNVPIIGASNIMGYTNEELYNNKILIIGRVGTLGIVQRKYNKSFPSDNTLVIKSNYYNFVYQILKLINYDSLNIGSTQPLISQKIIKEIEIILPSHNVLMKFEDLCNNFMQKININTYENKKLTKLRDILLPKLMSGEIDVSKVEI
ncbi:MAG: restriction endonuclease subunit S [Methanobacteriaceae archaeon]|jgi:type I restriction enzyme S subunit|nr:restriction endonuclease subunit S [Methanobacteriaceae archaeon]